MTTEVTKTETSELAVFDQLLADVTLAIKPIFEIEVKDAESEKRALTAGGQVAGLLKEVEKRRKEALEPLKLRVEAINNAAKMVQAVLGKPEQHVRTQLNLWAAEVKRQREEALRAQREKQELERKAAEEKRRQEQEALRLKQEAEREAREAAAKAEQERIQAELKFKQEEAAQVAGLFGSSRSPSQTEEEVAQARIAAQQKAEAERKALEEQQERERIAEEARLQREADERAKLAEREQKALEAQKVKGAKTELVIDIVDIWAVPREFLRDPEIKMTDVKKAYKMGMKEIPGLTIREEVSVSLRAESAPLVAVQ